MTHSRLGRGFFEVNADFLNEDSYHDGHELKLTGNGESEKRSIECAPIGFNLFVSPVSYEL